jgi:hypothetical protein
MIIASFSFTQVFLLLGEQHILLRRQHKPGAIIADVDPERLRPVREYERLMTEGEGELKALSNETDGHFE